MKKKSIRRRKKKPTHLKKRTRSKKPTPKKRPPKSRVKLATALATDTDESEITKTEISEDDDLFSEFGGEQ